MFGGIGMPELLVILVIVSIISCTNKIPQINRKFGE
jgi:Sec-independent protein translocase protein TatA